MAGVLRLLGVVVVVLGLSAAAVSGWLVAGDQQFRDAATAYARHPDHPLFRTEYWAAAVRHYALLAGAVGGLLGGIACGAMLIGLGDVLRRLPPR